MCHEYFDRTRDWEREPTETREPAETETEADDLPPFLNEDGGEDVEILADGEDVEILTDGGA